MRFLFSLALIAVATIASLNHSLFAADTLPVGDWQQHGLAVAQREQIEDAFQQGQRRQVFPGGALLIIHQGEVVLRQGFGLADIATNRAFTPDTPCRIASVTKPHTATMIVMLAEQGQLVLDQSIDRWLPEFRGVKIVGGAAASRAPTLAECLSHTTGFPGNDAIKRGTLDLPFTGTLQDTVAELARRDLLAQPGARWDYSRLGYMTAGRVAEVVTGRSYQDLMRDVLLTPIGATEATFDLTPELESRMAVSYQRTRSGFDIRRPEGELNSRTPNPGGGLISTLDDVGRLLLLHRNHGRVGDRQIVAEKSLARMYAAQPGTNGNGYGLGFNVLATRPDGTTSRVQHIGASGTLAWLDFDADLAIVVFTQVPTPQMQGWRNQLVRTIADVFRTPTDATEAPVE